MIHRVINTVYVIFKHICSNINDEEEFTYVEFGL